MQIELLYFARLRERLGVGAESLSLPSHCQDIEGLLCLLRERGGAWAEELAPGRIFRVSVNHDLVQGNAAIPAGAEVAIFPPVTGG